MFTNTNKTKCLLATGKHIAWKLDQDTAPCLKVVLDEAEISEVPLQKLLDATLDRDMAYDSHVDDLCKKLSKCLDLFKDISPYLQRKQKGTYYKVVIKPLLRYGSMVCDNCCTETLLT